MRKTLSLFSLIFLMLSSSSPLIAGGIDNKTNSSAEYIRTLNRNSATGAADIVVYNPAGTVKMEDGQYINFSTQYAKKNYSNTYLGSEYSSDKNDFVPSFFYVNKKDRLAYFASIYVPSGGGSVEYKNGDLTTLALTQKIFGTDPSSHYVEGKSYYTGYVMGMAYECKEGFFSASLSIRYLDALRTFKGYTTTVGGTRYKAEYEETDTGWGGIIGLNFNLDSSTNISIRYETETSLHLKTNEKKDDLPIPGGGLIKDGKGRDRNFPAVLALGISNKIYNKTNLHTNLTYYFNNDANWDDNYLTGADETKKDNGYDIGTAIEYTINKKWLASLGLMYTDMGIKVDNMSVEAPELDAVSFAGGFAYNINSELVLNLGISDTLYTSDKTSTGVKYEKNVIILATGIQYRFD